MRVTRQSAKRRAAEAMAENPQHPPPPNKRRVVLGEISSNVLGNPSLRSCSDPRARGRSRNPAKPISSSSIPASEKTPEEDVVGVGKVVSDDIDAGSDDPQMCGPYVAGIYEYLRNMEVRLFNSFHFSVIFSLIIGILEIMVYFSENWNLFIYLVIFGE